MGRCIRGIILILSSLTILGIVVFFVFNFELSYLRFRNVVAHASERYQVPPRLLASLIWQESHFQSLRRGKAGEIGLMQVMPASAREWALAENIESFSSADLFDPTTNTLAGAWYLGRALVRWKAKSDPTPYALAEYNAGASNAQRWDRAARASSVDFIEAISYPTTQRYVKDIMYRTDNFWRPWRLWRVR